MSIDMFTSLSIMFGSRTNEQVTIRALFEKILWSWCDRAQRRSVCMYKKRDG